MDVRHARFAVSLGAFAVWVALLAGLAVVSARRPPEVPAVPAP